MKIYTRTGDKGTTALFGGGRVSKTNDRIEAYGTVDETNSFIGLARSQLADGPHAHRIHQSLDAVQSELFTLGADLATPADAKARTPRVGDTQVKRLEAEIDELENDLPPLKQFIFPGGTPAAAALHVARTVCRRAERLVLRAADSDEISPAATVYLNRLSDYLFVLGRWVNRVEGGQEATWERES